MNLGGRHLTYCSNIHAGESWASVRGTLGDVLPELRRELGWSGPMGVGLRLSAEAAATLDDAPVFEEFTHFLRDGDCYVFTINGFPYGAFHGVRVKEAVYLPDWRDRARVDYTNRLASLLARLTRGREIVCPSVSTVPGAFRSTAQSHEARQEIAAGLLQHLASLVELRMSTGQTIALAIEPEPACLWETTGEVVAFIRDVLLDPAVLDAGARATRVPLTAEDVRRHVGICLDACHLAVAHEQPEEAVRGILREGLRIAKVQVSSALHVDDPSSPAARAALERFSDDVYLHQVTECSASVSRGFVDLPDALLAMAQGTAGTAPWRVHFHVPVFLEALGALRTTQAHLRETLSTVVRLSDCTQFEVETYTWDVLPAEHRLIGVVPAIARELAWTRRALVE